MTDHKDSNASRDDSTPSPDDEAWRDFVAGHSDDLNAVERSRAAKKFEKQAKRREKEALLSVNDLDPSAFAGGGMPRAAGPRDFTGSSWLDADDVMDQGSDFVPPNPEIGHVRTSKLVLWAMVVVGVAALAGCLMLPSLSSLLGAVGGALTIIGGTGLLMLHKGHTQTRADEFDDGARV
ncbi:hypothetical protein [Bifidobacterium avesanii]|uniref:Membrane associated protein n=1 Tax=Bifidobacterium avesanii TaxID=1798157 RepID=A0A7K3TLW0_9BIFI|nr:hypothetical protein [Bifidobacterium avesanii]KAB8288529.1 hypothetical protein DSM100685_1737 [Bifidobacterium avesanii]NEG79253.1 hypothetical protein [Bifidobacterium avesanii]